VDDNAVYLVFVRPVITDVTYWCQFCNSTVLEIFYTFCISTYFCFKCYFSHLWQDDRRNRWVCRAYVFI